MWLFKNAAPWSKYSSKIFSYLIHSQLNSIFGKSRTDRDIFILKLWILAEIKFITV